MNLNTFIILALPKFVIVSAYPVDCSVTQGCMIQQVPWQQEI